MNFIYILMTLWINVNIHDPKIAQPNLIDPPCSPDYEALKALYRSTDGAHWTNTWDTTDCTLSGWYGVYTDGNGRVTELVLYYNQLTGSIPSEIGNLSNLQGIHLGFNQLSGSIPSAFGNLTNLYSLVLSNNNLTGSIPAELGNHLQGQLDLSNNQLTGSIPSSLGNLTLLQYLQLNNNNLSGSIPGELGNLNNLNLLNLNNNQLTGCFSDALSGLCDNTNGPPMNSPIQFNLSNNPGLPGGGDFAAFCADGTGSCGASCSPDYEALKALYRSTDGAHWTNIWDTTDCMVDDWYGVTTDANGRVTSLILNDNGLNGHLPLEVGNLSFLQELHLNQNQLSGTIPIQLSSLNNLQFLNLNENQFSGIIPSQLGSLSNLYSLGLSQNQLTGIIPSQLGNLTNIQYLEFAYNQLSGNIPTTFANLTNLYSLWIAGNSLTGGIPSYLGNFTNLTFLGIGNNPLGGTIPVELGNLTNLTYLDCSLNQLTGSIPGQLGNLSHLSFLGLNYNQLSGNIPVQLGNLTQLQYLYLSNNQLTGTIPSQLGNLNELQWLNVNNNQLSGCFAVNLQNLCGHLTGYNFNDNVGLPGGGNFAAFCASGTGACSNCSGDIDIDSVCDNVDNCTLYNPTQLDSDCDGVGDACDKCPGGNDKIDNDHDGRPDCAFPPAYILLPESWKCGNNKVLVCDINHVNNQSNKCVNKNALDAQVRPGKPAYCGPCHEAQCVSSLIGNLSSKPIVPVHHSISRNVIHNADLNLFPNPSSGNFNVDLSDLELNQKCTLSIYSALGTRIYNQPVNSADRVSIQLDNRLAPNGIYILILNTSERTIEKRFVIQR